MDRISRRKLRTSVTLVRTLRSYVESHLSDLFDINKFDPAILEGDSPYGKDDFVEATLSINGHSLTLHIESPDADDPTKPCSLLSVRDDGTGMTVKGPIDGET